jgi:arabinofuranosyltransferase
LRASRVTAVLAAGPPLLLAAFAWSHRWATDDAYINFRVVDNLLHGNGPVFNAGERVEAYTSAAWLAILAFLNGVFGLPLEWTSVILGIGLTLFGLAAGSWGALLLARSSGRVGIGLPVGALVLVALRPMWDFSSSGLETGLGYAWLGGTFLALVAAYRRREAGAEAMQRGRPVRVLDPWGLAVLAGFGPLIRPDFAVFSLGFIAMLVVALRPARRRAVLAWLAVAAALPVAYQVFRMGYFAAVVPNTAIAKEAGEANWSRGWAYVKDFASPYALWLPVAALIALLAQRMRDDWLAGRRQAALLALIPAVSGGLHALFVVRVGGDFMHGRLLLPGLFGLALPAMVYVPAWRTRPLVIVAAVTIGWSAVCAAALHLPRDNPLKIHRFQDEHSFYAAFAHNPHPVTLDDYSRSDWVRAAQIVRALPPGTLAANAVRGLPNQYLVRERSYPELRLRPGVPARVAAGEFAVGVSGYAAGREVRIVDRLGLADPIAARLEFRPIATYRGEVWPPRYRAGHEKVLPAEWLIARFADTRTPAAIRVARGSPGIAAARRAIGCGDLARLLRAVNRPLTFDRFVSNIGTAWELRDFRIPPEPIRAAAAC